MIRPQRLLELGVLPVIWAVFVFAALQTKGIVSEAEHSVCGPWGCGPEIGDLVAMHAAWLAVVGPPLIYFSYKANLSSKLLRRIAVGLFAVGILGMLTVIAWQWLIWLPSASTWSKDYIWQRCGFVIVTSVDFPLIPAVILGMVLAGVNLAREWRRGVAMRSRVTPSEEREAVSIG
jgi:mannose/fructose/N-acetylgalactosamine-specific phosphotransferase system component IIC